MVIISLEAISKVTLKMHETRPRFTIIIFLKTLSDMI